MQLFKGSGRAVPSLISVAILSGCATAIKPDDLQTPGNITCVNLKDPLSFTGRYGLLKIPRTTRLERGPYWSEKVDSKGTYYRAPPGGVLITSEKGAGATADGGFYVPDDVNQSITIYNYYSTVAVPVQIPPAGADCSTIGYTRNPSTSKVSLVSFAVNSATGGVIGQSVTSGSSLSDGQKVGVGAAGGLIAGLIVSAMINADLGKIIPALPIQDMEFMNKLRALAADRVPVNELQLPTKLDDTQPAAPAASKQSDDDK